MLQLKVTVEGLLALPSVNVWNVPGGLERLDRCLRHILKHRLKVSMVCLLHWVIICNYSQKDNNFVMTTGNCNRLMLLCTGRIQSIR